jgi:hypothetical protein
MEPLKKVGVPAMEDNKQLAVRYMVDITDIPWL